MARQSKKRARYDGAPYSKREKPRLHTARAKKSLGQHFLTNTTILKKIVDSGGVSAEDTVLEIGPGRGSLTEELLKSGATVIAVEKDEGLVESLKEKFTDETQSGRLVLIEGDVLKMREVIEDILSRFSRGYKIVSNIPYYITGSILRLIFSLNALPSVVVILVQDEVARRIAVPDGKKESVLSLSVKAYGSPRRGAKIKAGSFSPAPKVDSAILIVENVSRDFFSDTDESVFFNVLKRSFSQKRKTLLNTLFAKNKERGRLVLKTIGLPESVRPENVSLEHWERIIEGARNGL